MDNIVVKVSGVSKNFKLPHEKTSSVKNLFTQLFGYVRKRRTYETQHALQDVSFNIRKGEFFGIVGRNGSGKSTLLKMLAGIYQPTKGSLHVDGKLVPFIELGVGFNPELTGRENVYLNGALLGFSKKEVDEMYSDIVEFSELEKFMDQKLKNYSSGMQVRLAFSIATRAKADILLVDEVLAVGDADFQRKCYDYFQQLKGSDTTVIFVSHNMNAVREYCDRALLIENSKVVDIAESDKIAKLYSSMFIDETVTLTKRTGGARWGNNLVKYERVNISTKVLKNEKELVVTAKAKASDQIEGIIFGFSLKNAAKQVILGTNTQLENQDIKRLEKGEAIELSWTIPNIFSDGQYSIDITSVLKNGQECDWWEDAISFRTLRPEEHAPYVVSPKIKLSVER